MTRHQPAASCWRLHPKFRYSSLVLSTLRRGQVASRWSPVETQLWPLKHLVIGTTILDFVIGWAMPYLPVHSQRPVRLPTTSSAPLHSAMPWSTDSKPWAMPKPESLWWIAPAIGAPNFCLCDRSLKSTNLAILTGPWFVPALNSIVFLSAAIRETTFEVKWLNLRVFSHACTLRPAGY